MKEQKGGSSGREKEMEREKEKTKREKTRDGKREKERETPQDFDNEIIQRTKVIEIFNSLRFGIRTVKHI